MDRKAAAAAVSIASNTTLVIGKLVVGLVTGSVSIVSEAAHSATDLCASVIAYASVRASGRPADKEHPFGHGKFENLSGAIEAVLIVAAAALIVHQAVNKLRGAAEVESIHLGIWVMGVSVVTNVIVSRYLFRVARETDSIALEADAHHLSTDVWTSLGVFAGLVLIRLTGWHVMDPIIALGVAALIVRVGVVLTWKAVGPLLDIQLPDAEVRQLQEIVTATPNVCGVHKMRTRKSGPFREVDLHLVVPAGMPVDEAHDIADSIERRMREQFPNTCVITHIEPDTQEDTG